MKKWKKDLINNIKRLYLEVYEIHVEVELVPINMVSHNIQYKLTDTSTNRTGILTIADYNISNINHDEDYDQILNKGKVKTTTRGRDHYVKDAMPDPSEFS